jgi:hypothetical protein
LHSRDKVAGEIGCCCRGAGIEAEFPVLRVSLLVSGKGERMAYVMCMGVQRIPLKVGHGEDTADNAGVNAEEGTGETCLRS